MSDKEGEVSLHSIDETRKKRKNKGRKSEAHCSINIGYGESQRGFEVISPRRKKRIP